VSRWAHLSILSGESVRALQPESRELNADRAGIIDQRLKVDDCETTDR
jgi:hypothetical protein